MWKSVFTFGLILTLSMIYLFITVDKHEATYFYKLNYLKIQ